jgi:hypothetical protein
MNEAERLKKQVNEKWAIEQSIVEALKHQEPSPLTKERLGILETNQKNFMRELTEFKNDYKTAHEDLKRELKSDFKIYSDDVKKIICDFKEEFKADIANKADKWVEKVIWGMISFVSIGLFSYIGVVIIQAIIHFNK